MRKKFISVITALIMSAVCLVSCGNDIVSKTGSDSRAESTSAVKTTTSASESAGQSEPPEQTQTETTTTTSAASSELTTTAETTVSEAEKTVTSADTTTSQATTESEKVTTEKQTPVDVTLPYHNAGVLYCADDGEYLYSKNVSKRISIASTTKLLTASLAVNYLEADKLLTVGNEIWFIKPYSTVANLSVGNMLTTQQLLYGLILPSGNDAAYTVAVNVARAANPGKTLTDAQAVEVFVSMMNSFAAQLGMTSSHFANPEGWDDAGHYSTLEDMIKLTRYAMGQPLIAQVVSTHFKSVQFASGQYVSWTNTNSLLDKGSSFYLPEAVGGKTGTTEDAGYCVIAVIRHGGKTYYCAAMGCKQPSDRYRIVHSILKSKLGI